MTSKASKEQDRQRLRELVLEGLASAPAGEADAAYFEGLRERVREHARSLDTPGSTDYSVR